MTNITIYSVGGTQQENTNTVNIGGVVWNAPFGQTQEVEDGLRELTVNKTTLPHQIPVMVEARGYDTILNITVNEDTIHVALGE